MEDKQNEELRPQRPKKRKLRWGRLLLLLVMIILTQQTLILRVLILITKVES